MAQSDWMKKPSMTFPEWMLDEIEERREKGESRSEYVREAVKARFRDEDSDDWQPVDDDFENRFDE